MKGILQFLKHDEGATAVEYALIASAIAGLICGIVILLGGKVLNLFQSVNSSAW
jgi:pilus assembly protein Flp/PilA